LFGWRRERQANRGGFIVPRLEPLEDRLTPAALPAFNPAIALQLGVSQGLVTRPEIAQSPSNQLTGQFLFLYVQSGQQNPADTNALVRAQFILVSNLNLAILDTQLQVMDPFLAASFADTQNAIISNPVYTTLGGTSLGTVAAALPLNVLNAPSFQPAVANFQLAYFLALQQSGNNAGDLNNLVRAETTLTLDRIFVVLGAALNVNDPTLSADLTNAQNAIAANPANNTTFGFVTGQLTQSLTVSAFLPPP
jgi:hypothetical protein